jgi:hypothetical protein
MFAQLEKKFSFEFNTAETTIEIHSLQISGFLMNLCHVVIVVQDWQVDPSLIR